MEDAAIIAFIVSDHTRDHHMIQQLITIAKNTFTESIRQPVFLVLIVAGLIFLGFIDPSVSAYSMQVDIQQGDTKILIDTGFGTIFIIGLLLAAFTATHMLSRELENKTVLTVVSKPIARPVFVVGKYLGVAAAIAVAYLLLTLIFLFTIRHGVMAAAYNRLDYPVLFFAIGAAVIAFAVATFGNYFYRWLFTSTLVFILTAAELIAFFCVLFISKQWAFQSPLTEFSAHHGQMIQILIGLVMVFEAVLILTAIALACSTRLGQIMTLVICIGVFLIGLISNALGSMVNQKLHIPAQASLNTNLHAIFTNSDISAAQKVAFVLAKLIYVLSPNLQFLWPSDAITQGHPFTIVYLATCSTYAAFYTVAMLALATALFQTREVG